MLNRRHIRLKVMQLLYALDISKFNYDFDLNKELFKSLEDIYDLYLRRCKGVNYKPSFFQQYSI